jgi:hypothetical protein
VTSSFIAQWVGNLSGGGVATLVVWLILTGRLVPRRQHEEAIAAQRQRGDDWHAAWDAEVARGDVRDRQLGEVLSALRRPPLPAPPGPTVNELRAGGRARELPGDWSPEGAVT